MNDVKEAVLELARQLPEECTWDEVMYRIKDRLVEILTVVHAARHLTDGDND